MGELAGRYGRRRVIGFAIALMPIGVVLTLPDNLWLMILGVGVVTIGFFGGHSIASSWVGLRAETAKAQASALYLFFYYAGSSLAGSIGGWVFAFGAWPGVAAFVGAMSGARAPHRDEARARAPAGASARFVRGGGSLMEWRDEGLIIGVRRHGEASTIVEAMTRAHGRHLGLVRGGRSARLQRDAPARQYGRPRLARPARRASGLVRRRASGAAGGQADGKRAGARRRQLSRRAPAGPARARSARGRFTRRRASSPTRSTTARCAPTLIARFEAQILAECGFRLDLGRCAATGATDDLVYVSPKSGRAVDERARVHDRDVGVLEALGDRVALEGQAPEHDLGVELVLRAAEGAEVDEGLGGGHGGGD